MVQEGDGGGGSNTAEQLQVASAAAAVRITALWQDADVEDYRRQWRMISMRWRIYDNEGAPSCLSSHLSPSLRLPVCLCDTMLWHIYGHEGGPCNSSPLSLCLSPSVSFSVCLCVSLRVSLSLCLSPSLARSLAHSLPSACARARSLSLCPVSVSVSWAPC